MANKLLTDQAAVLNDEELAAMAGGWSITPVEKNGAWYGALDQEATIDLESIKDPAKKQSALQFASSVAGKSLVDFIPFK